MELEITVVDAFTDAVFAGNPAAVIITEQWLPDALMQSIAAENNLSETAFLVLAEAATYLTRWFSPLTEIDCCGHATLASAFVLFNKNPELTRIKFCAQAVGELSVEKTQSGQIQMNFHWSFFDCWWQSFSARFGRSRTQFSLEFVYCRHRLLGIFLEFFIIKLNTYYGIVYCSRHLIFHLLPCLIC